jgi:hypothetical protein
MRRSCQDSCNWPRPKALFGWVKSMADVNNLDAIGSVVKTPRTCCEIDARCKIMHLVLLTVLMYRFGIFRGTVDHETGSETWSRRRCGNSSNSGDCTQGP